jgi:hypothetical protein
LSIEISARLSRERNNGRSLLHCDNLLILLSFLGDFVGVFVSRLPYDRKSLIPILPNSIATWLTLETSREQKATRLLFPECVGL